MLDECVQGRLRARDVCSYHAGNTHQHELGFVDRRQRHEDRARRIALAETLRHRDGQPCLPDPSWTGQSDEPRPGQLNKPRHVFDGLFSTDQRGAVHR